MLGAHANHFCIKVATCMCVLVRNKLTNVCRIVRKCVIFKFSDFLSFSFHFMCICFLLSVSNINIKPVNPPHSSISYGKLAVWQREMQVNSKKYLGYNSKTVSNPTHKGAEQIVPMGNMLIDIWCSTPLSTIFQLFLGCRLFLVERTGVPRDKKLISRKSLLNLIT